MKTWLFDFDGTLVDSMPTYAGVMLRILDENHIPYGDDIIKITTPLGYTGAASLFREMGLDRPVDEIVSLMQHYAVEAYTNTVPAKEHVIDVLHELKARGDDLNVLTASPHMALDPCLKRLGIFELFTNVWSCEDFGTTKADPQIYLLAAQRLQKSAEEIWFLDDNLGADKTAKSAGMHVCGVYDESSAEYTDQIKAVCDAYIDDFLQLLELHC